MSSSPRLRFLRNSNLRERPNPETLVSGQPAVNFNPSSPGLFFSDFDENLVKVGPTAIGVEPPSSQPGLGESWLQTSAPSQDFPVLWVFNGEDWVGVELPLIYTPPEP